MGLAMSINNNDIRNFDFFIAEMGARQVGDIAELCEFCPPEYSLITGVCPQHLESFGSIENIVKAKGEILSGCKKAIIASDCSAFIRGIFLPQTYSRLRKGRKKRLQRKYVYALFRQRNGVCTYKAFGRARGGQYRYSGNACARAGHERKGNCLILRKA